MRRSANSKRLKILTPARFGDERGLFSEVFNEQRFAEAGIVVHFVQDNHSVVREGRARYGACTSRAPLRAGQTRPRLARPHPRRCRRYAPLLAHLWPSCGASSSRPRTGGSSSCRSALRTASAPSSRGPRSSTSVSTYYSAAHDRGLAWDDPALAIHWPVQSDAGDPVRQGSAATEAGRPADLLQLRSHAHPCHWNGMARWRGPSPSGRAAHGASVRLVGRPALDLTMPSTVNAVIEAHGGDVIVNAAAYTAVDQAEAEPETRDGGERGRRRPRRASRGVARGTDRPSLDRLRVRRPNRTVPIGRPTQSGRLVSTAARSSPARSPSQTANPELRHPAHRVGLQPIRQELRQDHAARSPPPARRSRSWPISTAPRPAPSTSLTASSKSAVICRTHPHEKSLRGVFHMTGTGATTWAEFAAAVFSDIRRRGRAQRARARRSRRPSIRRPPDARRIRVSTCASLQPHMAFAPFLAAFACSVRRAHSEQLSA